MKFFDKWLMKKFKWAWAKHREDASKGGEPMMASATLRSQRFQTRGLNVTIYPANGGHVVEYHSYDEKTDRHTGNLHIIKHDDDLGQSIGHIITLEDRKSTRLNSSH